MQIAVFHSLAHLSEGGMFAGAYREIDLDRQHEEEEEEEEINLRNPADSGICPLQQPEGLTTKKYRHRASKTEALVVIRYIAEVGIRTKSRCGRNGKRGEKEFTDAISLQVRCIAFHPRSTLQKLRLRSSSNSACIGKNLSDSL